MVQGKGKSTHTQETRKTILAKADTQHIDLPIQKKFKAGVEAYKKRLEELSTAKDREEQSATFDAAVKARDKLYKILNAVDDTNTRVHLINHVEGKTGLRTIAFANELGAEYRQIRNARQSAALAPQGRSRTPLEEQYDKELKLMRK